MISIPVLINFDQSKQIGEMTIDESKLPKSPDYAFALSYLVNGCNLNSNVDTDHELMAVSLVSDDNYFKYLESKNDKTTR